MQLPKTCDMLFDNFQVYVRFMQVNMSSEWIKSTTLSGNTAVSSTGTQPTGKTQNGGTVTSNGSEIFKTEAMKGFHSTILTDIKNLNKARKVTWNDMQGKTGKEALKQIFSNIKHNIRAAWMGKKGELRASEQLKTDIGEMEAMLKATDVDPDFVEDCKKFYDDNLRKMRPGGYADTKAKLMNLIGDKDKDGSLKADVNKFLEGYISGKNETFDADLLTNRFQKLFANGTQGTNREVEQFKTLLQSYESKLPQSKLRKEIATLFDNELINEAREKMCRDVDMKRDALIKHIEAFAKGDYGFSGVARMDLGDYYTDYATDGETTDTVGNAGQTAFEQLKQEFQKAFPNGGVHKFESLLEGVFGKSGTVKQLKALVNDAATAQKEKVKNEKPVPQKSSEFLKNLPRCLNRELEGEGQYNTLTDRVLEMFDESFQGFGKTREKLKSLCHAREKEMQSDFLVFNRLEHILEKVEADDG